MLKISRIKPQNIKANLSNNQAETHYKEIEIKLKIENLTESFICTKHPEDKGIFSAMIAMNFIVNSVLQMIIQTIIRVCRS